MVDGALLRSRPRRGNAEADDAEPRRGDPDNSPGREPRDTDPRQSLLSPDRATQPLCHGADQARGAHEVRTYTQVDEGRRRPLPTEASPAEPLTASDGLDEKPQRVPFQAGFHSERVVGSSFTVGYSVPPAPPRVLIPQKGTERTEPFSEG